MASSRRPTSSLPAWGLRGLPHLLLGRPFLPPILNFLVTNRCTLRCRHCFNWKSEGSRPELSLEEIRWISLNLGPLAFLILAGGEPFMREDLPGIVEAFYRSNGVRNIVVLTDGQLTERVLDAVERIFDACPGLHLAVGVSLDGPEEVHDRIRGRAGAFQRAVETFRALAAVRERFPGLDLQTCSVLMADNQDVFDSLLDFIRDDLKPDKVALNLIRQDPRDPSLLQVSVDRYEAVTRRIREETFRGRFKNKYGHDTTGFVTLTDLHMHDLVARTRRTGRAQLPCRAGSISAVLFHDGTLAPCEILRPWGNLRDTGYRPEPIWLSPVADACRRKIRSGCFCTHEIDCFLPSIPFSPAHYPALARLAYEWKKAAGWKKVN